MLDRIVTAGLEGVGRAVMEILREPDDLPEAPAPRGDEAPVVLVGGMAATDPERVAGLVTLETPFDLYRLRLPVFGAATAVTAAGTLGLPGVATASCLVGSCCRDFRAVLRRPLPDRMPFTSIHSREDRAVPADASVDPAARNVEVTGSHLGLLTRRAAREAVTDALASRTAAPSPVG